MIKILHGDDEFSISEAVRKAKIAVGPEEARDPNTTILEGAKFKPFDIIAAASSMPFLADRRLVLVYGLLGRLDARGANTGADWDTIPNALADLPGTSDVLFVEDVTLRRNGRGVKTAGAGADIHEHRVPRGGALENWTRDRFTHHGASAARDAVSRLTWLVGPKMRLLNSEVQKLATFAGEREVTRADVDLLVSYAREASIFATVDAVLERRAAVAMRLMHDLLLGGSTVGNIISMLARQVRLVLLAGDLKQRGVSIDDIGRRAGISNSYALEKTLRQVERFNYEYLAAVHHRLLEADMSIKTGQQDEQLALELLVGRLSVA